MIKKIKPEDEINYILDEIDDSEDETLRDAKKFLTLMEEFDVKEGSNMEENLRKNKDEIIKNRSELIDKNIEVSPSENISIVESGELLEDFILVRETLREDIKSTRIVLEALSKDLSTITADELNGQVLLAFSDLKKANVNSMKLLIDSYEKIARTQVEVKKLTQELITETNRAEQNNQDGGTSIQNAVFVGTPSELLASLKNG